MRLSMLKAKLHQATLTMTDLYYEGSITIDSELLDAANILPYEKVQVVNVNNGSRLETYTIPAERGSRTVCLNGPEARRHKPRVVLVDEYNEPKEIMNVSGDELAAVRDL